METPSKELTKLGVECCSQGKFFSEFYHKIGQDDIVIMWVGTRNESWLDAMSNLKCRKFLRNIDSCKSDRILFKREQEIFFRVGFEAMLVTYCTDYNRNFLLERGIKSIDYPHLIDFSNSRDIEKVEKKFDILISGQLSEKSYPTRTKLANLFLKEDNKKKYKVAYLQHPGHSKSQVIHQFYGEKYVDLASACKLSITCTGDDDALVLKYLEFAKAASLPLGDCPSNMPEKAKLSMLEISKEMSDEKILSIVDEILRNEDLLKEKTKSYQSAMTIFDVASTKNVLEKIKNLQM